MYDIDASQLSPGDILTSVGDGFPCVPLGEQRTVERDYRGGIFIRCNCGKHYLAGELKGLARQMHDKPWRPSKLLAFLARLFGWRISETARRMPF